MKLKLYTLFTLFSLILSGCVFAQGEEPVSPPPDQSLWQTLVMIGIALAFFYLILWRPEQKRRQALENQRNSLKKGDRVVAMGIIGTVVKINDQTVILKMYDGTKLEFFKSVITDTMPEEGNKDGNKKVELIADDEA